MSFDTKLWESDPIEFLVRRKFPLQSVRPAAFSHPKFAMRRERETEYRNQLKEIDPSVLLARAKALADADAEQASAKLAREEAQHFFNLPYARADIYHWSRVSLWTLDEAVALSLDRDPRIVNFESIKAYRNRSFFVANFEARRMLVTRARDAGQLWDQTIPGIFLAWAQRMRIDVPANLAGAVKEMGGQIADWKALFDGQKEIAELAAKNAARFQQCHTDALAQLRESQDRVGVLEGALEAERSKLPPDRDLKTRERESLLKLVIGMALAGYSYDPKAGRSPIVKEIADDLARAGVALDADTIRKYLQEARELLPPEE